MRCPRCSSERVYLSLSGNDRLPWVIRGLVVCGRCYACSKKFYRLKLTRSASQLYRERRWAA